LTYSLEDSVRRLLEWELIDEVAIVDGDLTVSSAARRNLNLRVERRLGDSSLIKQVTTGAADAADSLIREAGFYAFCAEERAAAAVASSMPRLRGTLDSGRVLVLELLENARTLWQEYGERDPHELPLTAPLALGWALGALHSTFRESILATDPRLGRLARDCPPCFDLHRPHPGILRDASPARLELCRSVQREASLRDGLAAARSAWCCETVIHGDVRPDNVLVTRRSGAPAIWLVDWEFVQHGDPAWDVGCALHDHLMFWVRSMSLDPHLDAAERVATARCPLPALHVAMRALWTGYLATGAGGDPGVEAVLARAVRFSGVRLLQTAWEKARQLDHQSATGVLVLQLAANLLADPERAVSDLYGFEQPISPPRARS
jgi:hypothetical protein